MVRLSVLNGDEFIFIYSKFFSFHHYTWRFNVHWLLTQDEIKQIYYSKDNNLKPSDNHFNSNTIETI